MKATLTAGWRAEHWLATAALALGALAVVGNPYSGHVVTLDTRELAMLVERRADHVTVKELADWIIEGRDDFRLLDIRDAAAYVEYHMPGAEHVPLGELSDYPLWRNETIVLYSDGGIHASQAWFLLRAQGFRGVYTLLGGLDGWKDEILFPALPAEADASEAAAFERARFVSRYFGGQPRSGEAEVAAAAPVPLPKVDPGSAPPVAPRRAKKKEGC